MPAREFPNLGLKGGYDEHESGWADDQNLNLLKLSVLTQGTVIDKVAAEPGVVTAGAVYLLDETNATNPNAVAVYDGPTGEEDWVYFAPEDGWLLFNQAEGYYEKFDGTVWAELATGGGGGGISDAPADGKLYGRQDNAWEEIISAAEAGGWEIIEKRTISAAAQNQDFVGLAGYDEFLIVSRGITYGGGNNAMSLRVSTDNGATFYSGATNYKSISKAGAEADGSHFGNNSENLGATHTAVYIVRGNKAGSLPYCTTTAGQDPRIFVASTDKINALRLTTNSGAGTISGGTITLLGLRTGAANDVIYPFRGCRAGRSANLAIGASAVVPWTTEFYDYGGWHDNAVNNTRFTVPAGVKRVRITGQIEIQSPSGGQSFQVRKNGTSTQVATVQVGNSPFTYTVAHFDSGVIDVVPGDYFEAFTEGNGTLVAGRTFLFIEAVSDRVSRSDLSPTINVQAGAAYSLLAADDGNIVEMTSGAANTVTIPANATTGIAVGSTFSVVQIGAGVTTIQAAAGVTLNGVAEGSADLSGQWGGISLYKRATDEWVIQGAHGGVS